MIASHSIFRRYDLQSVRANRNWIMDTPSASPKAKERPIFRAGSGFELMRELLETASARTIDSSGRVVEGAKTEDPILSTSNPDPRAALIAKARDTRNWEINPFQDLTSGLSTRENVFTPQDVASLAQILRDKGGFVSGVNMATQDGRLHLATFPARESETWKRMESAFEAALKPPSAPHVDSSPTGIFKIDPRLRQPKSS